MMMMTTVECVTDGENSGFCPLGIWWMDVTDLDGRATKRARRRLTQEEKSFVCNVLGCTKRYGSSRALWGHKKKKHGTGGDSRRISEPAALTTNAQGEDDDTDDVNVSEFFSRVKQLLDGMAHTITNNNSRLLAAMGAPLPSVETQEHILSLLSRMMDELHEVWQRHAQDMQRVIANDGEGVPQ